MPTGPLGDRSGRVAGPIPLSVERKMLRAKLKRDRGLEREAAGALGGARPWGSRCGPSRGHCPRRRRCFSQITVSIWMRLANGYMNPSRPASLRRSELRRAGRRGRGTTTQRTEPRTEQNPRPPPWVSSRMLCRQCVVANMAIPSGRPHSSPHWQLRTRTTCRIAGPLTAW